MLGQPHTLEAGRGDEDSPHRKGVMKNLSWVSGLPETDDMGVTMSFLGQAIQEFFSLISSFSFFFSYQTCILC